MPLMQSAKVLFLVDGNMEQKFLQSQCKKAAIQRINCNGSKVALGAIARRVATLIRLQNNRIHRTIVLFDREDRTEDAQQLANELRAAIGAEGVDVNAVVVGCADRCSEGWIVCDKEIVEQHLGIEIPDQVVAGGKKHALRELFESVGRSYLETVDGVELLRKVRPSAISEICPSARAFFATANVDCFWIGR